MNRITRISIAVLLTVSCGAPVAPAAVRAHGKRTPHLRRHVAAPRPAQAGLIVAWNPETHTYGMPDAAQLSTLSAAEKNALSRSFEGLVQVRHPDGSVSVDLQGRFQEFAVVRVGPDGKPVYRCLDDSATVRRALLEPLPARPALEER